MREPRENRIRPEEVKRACIKKAKIKIYLRGFRVLRIQFIGSPEKNIIPNKRKKTRAKPTKFLMAKRAKTNRKTRIIFTLGSSR